MVLKHNAKVTLFLWFANENNICLSFDINKNNAHTKQLISLLNYETKWDEGVNTILILKLG